MTFNREDIKINGKFIKTVWEACLFFCADSEMEDNTKMNDDLLKPEQIVKQQMEFV